MWKGTAMGESIVKLVLVLLYNHKVYGVGSVTYYLQKNVTSYNKGGNGDKFHDKQEQREMPVYYSICF